MMMIQRGATKTAARSVIHRRALPNAAMALTGAFSPTSTSSSCPNIPSQSISASSFSSSSKDSGLHYPVISKADFGSFKEYSVIHTDRSLNLMSDPFQRVMRDLNSLLKYTYNADKVVIIPGYV